MTIKVEQRFYLIVVFLIITVIRSNDAQYSQVCPTAYWNSTFEVIAGISGVASNTPTTLTGPHDMYFLPNRTFYVLEYQGFRLQRFSPGSFTAVTIPNLTLSNPSCISLDSAGAIYILDTSNYRVVRWVNTVVTVVAGGRGNGGGLNQIGVSHGMQIDANNNIFVAEASNHRVTMWTNGNPNISQVVAGGNGAGSSAFQFNYPHALFMDVNNTMYIADFNNHRIVRWFFGAIMGTTVAGVTGSAGSWAYQLNYPTYMAMDQFGFLYIMDSGNDRVMRWLPGASYGVAIINEGSMNTPRGLRIDPLGNIVVADYQMHRVLSFAMICPPNATTTVAPTTQVQTPVCATAAWNQTFSVIAGSLGGNRGTTSTLLYNPHNFHIDVYGNLYVVDCENHRIQRFPRGSPFGTTVAGVTSSPGGSLSQLYWPTAMFVDANNTMYILEYQTCRVMRWRLGDPMGNVIAAGQGCGGGLNQIDNSYGLFVDSRMHIYIGDWRNHRVVRWTSANLTFGTLVAGGNGLGSTADRLNYPWGVFVDVNQSVYVVDRNNHRVQFWPAGAIQGMTVAGTTGDPGPWAYQLSSPTAITLDSAGLIYILDTGNNRVQRWRFGATFGTTVVAASMNTPYGLSFDAGGNIVIADMFNHRILSFGITCPVSTTTTPIPPTTPTTPLCPTAIWNTTMNSRGGSPGNRGTSNVLLNYPYGVAFDGNQNMYVADNNNHRIQFYAPGSFTAITVAGNSGSAGGSLSELNTPSSVFVDPSRTMYILDTTNYRVLRWKFGDPMGTVIAGGRGAGASLGQISTSYVMFVDNQYNVFVADSGNDRVTKWLPTNTTSAILVAGGNGAGNTAERLNNPWGITVDPTTQALYVVDRNNHRVMMWPNGAMSGVLVAGSTSDAGPWSYQFSSPTSIILDPYGFIYVLDTGNNRVQKWWPGAAFGSTVLTGSFAVPLSMTLDRANSLVITDTNNHRIVSFGVLCPSSTTTTTAPPTLTTASVCPTAIWNQTFSVVAGSSGNRGSSSILLNNPADMAFDGYYNLYVADSTNHRIQQYRQGSLTGITVAGNSGSAGGGLSELNNPSAICMDRNQTMFILDTTNYRVLRWRLGDPMGVVVAGGRSWGSSLTQITTSYAMYVDSQYNIYVSEFGNHRVSKWLPTNTSSGILVAGGNGAGSTLDRLNGPWGIFVNVNDTIFVADRNNHRVMMWTAGSMTGVLVAGSTSDPGPYAYQFDTPTGLTFDQLGFMYVLDSANSRVQRWTIGASYGFTVAASSMSSPQGLTVGPLGNILVADTQNCRVLSFGLTCPLSTTTTAAPPTQAAVPVCPTAVWNASFSTVVGAMSTAGSTTTLLNAPSDVSFDAFGNMYIADRDNHRIQSYRPGSNVGTTVAGVTGTAGSRRSELARPYHIHVTPNATMFILDTDNYRVLRWQVGEPAGIIVAGGRGSGTTFDRLGTCYCMFVDSQYNIFIADYTNHRIVRWSVTNTSAGQLVAGGNGAGNTADKLNSPWGVFVDANNTVYIADRLNHRVQRWAWGAATGTTVAGSTSDPGPWSYQLNNPLALSVDQQGFMYILDFTNDRIQRWWPGASFGVTVAATIMSSPHSFKLDRQGNIVICDTNYHRVIRFGIMCPVATTTTAAPTIQPAVTLCPTATYNQTLSSLAGSINTAGSTATLLSSPFDVGFDGYSNMYVVDYNNHRVQRFRQGSNIGLTIAGFSLGSGASRSELYYPIAISVTANGTMFILDQYNFRVLRWDAGDQLGYVVAGGRGLSSAFTNMGYGGGLFVDNFYNVYITEQTYHRVTLWSNGNTTAGRLVAGGNGAGNTADKLTNPWGVYVDGNGTIFVVDRSNHRVQRWSVGAASGTTVAGSTSDPGPWSYQFSSPTSITFDPYGFMYVLDSGNSRVQKWWPGAAYGSTVVAAVMNTPMGMTIDRFGNLVIADTSQHRVISFGLTCPASTTTTTRPTTPAAVPVCPTAIWNSSFITVAGAISNAGSTATLISAPYDVTFDSYRNMYVADYNNHRIQMYRFGSNVGTTVAGSVGSAGSGRSELYNPTAIFVDNNGTMFISDSMNYRVMRWVVGESVGTVVVGGRGSGAAYNQVGRAFCMFVDNQQNIYLSDNTNHRVTRWNNGNNTISFLVAGGNGAGSTAAQLNSPWGVFVDSQSTVFVVDRSNHRVQRWPLAAALGTTVAGSTSDPGPWSYQFNSPTAIAFDPYGFMYVMDSGNDRVQKWWPGASFGMTVATTTMATPLGMQFDRLGNIVIADTSYHRVISFSMVCPPTTTTTAAPPIQPLIPICATAIWNQTLNIEAGSTANLGTTSTLLYNPYDIAFDGYGNMYVADTSNHRIQRYLNGAYGGTTIAGNSGAWGTGRSELYNPYAIHVTTNGTMFILDTLNYRVLRWASTEPLGTVVVNGRGAGSTLDRIGASYSMFVDANLNIFVSESSNHRITRWTAGNNTVGTLVAGGNGAGVTADRLNSPWGIHVDSNNAIFIVDRNNHRIQRWVIGATSATTVAGSTSDPGPWSYQFSSPTAITMDPFGFLFILDTGNNRVQKWLPGASFGVTIASGSLSSPSGMKIDRSGNLYIADTSNHRVVSYGITCPLPTTTPPPSTTRAAVSLCATAQWNGTFTIEAGGTAAAGSASHLLSSPYDVTIDVYQNYYVADYNNHRIQFFRRGSNIGATVAGYNLAAGSTRSELYQPTAILVDANSVMYILDSMNYRVLRWVTGEPLGTVIVGGRGTGAQFDRIGRSFAMFMDNQLNIYISDNTNNRVTRWAAGNNTISTLVAGGNGAGNTADKLNSPWGVYVDNGNAIYVVDRNNHRVQKWPPGSAMGTTVAGSTSDPGPWSYQLSSPTSITMDPYGSLFILDTGNNRVQRWVQGENYGLTVLSASMSSPMGMQLDPAGTVYIADTSNHRVLSFSVWCPVTTTTTSLPPIVTTTPLCQTASWNSTVTVVTGTTAGAGSTSTFLSSPFDVTFDVYKNMYVADAGNHRIQIYRPDSNIGTTVAGVTAAAGASRAELNSPSAVFVDPNNNMYILDTNNYRVLRWQLGEAFGVIVVNGRGAGTTLDRIGLSYCMFLDMQYNIYISDAGNHRVVLWTAGNNTISRVVAGGAGAGSALDRLNSPRGVYVTNAGVVFVVDRGNHRVQRWAPGAATGSTVAGESTVAGSWSYQLNSPTAMISDIYGYLYILDAGNNRIQKWLPGTTFGVTIVQATMSTPLGMSFDGFANIVVADTSNHRIAMFALGCPNPTTVTAPPPTLPPYASCWTGLFNTSWMIAAGGSSTAGSLPTHLNTPMDVFVDGLQNIYVADFVNSRIQKFAPGQIAATTMAGATLAGGASFSELNDPASIFVDLSGAMYIADSANYRVLKWIQNQPVGAVVAGGRGVGTTLDKLGLVYSIYVNSQGSVYVSENTNHRVTLWFAWNTTAGQVVAGNNAAGTGLHQLNSPWGVHADSTQAVYVVDRANHRVVKWTAGASSGTVIAGTTGTSGATAALLSSPTAIAIDTNNFMYIMDAGNNRVQRFPPGSTTGETVAAMAFNAPRGMRVDFMGNIYIADSANHRVILFRCVYNVTTTTITTSTTTSDSSTTTSTTTVTTTSTTSITTTSSTTSTTPFIGTTTTATTTSTTSTTSVSTTTTETTTTTSETTTTTTTQTTTSTTSSTTSTGTTTTTTSATTTTTTSATTTTTTSATTTTTTSVTTTTTTSVTTTSTTSATTTTTTSATTTTSTSATTETTTSATTATTTPGVGGVVVVAGGGGSGSGSGSSTGGSTSTGTIVGAVIGGLGGLALTLGLGFFLADKLGLGAGAGSKAAASSSSQATSGGQAFTSNAKGKVGPESSSKAGKGGNANSSNANSSNANNNAANRGANNPSNNANNGNSNNPSNQSSNKPSNSNSNGNSNNSNQPSNKPTNNNQPSQSKTTSKPQSPRVQVSQSTSDPSTIRLDIDDRSYDVHKYAENKP